MEACEVREATSNWREARRRAGPSEERKAAERSGRDAGSNPALGEPLAGRCPTSEEEQSREAEGTTEEIVRETSEAPGEEPGPWSVRLWICGKLLDAGPDCAGDLAVVWSSLHSQSGPHLKRTKQ